MLNAIFVVLILASVLLAAFGTPVGEDGTLTTAITDQAKYAVTTAINLIGIMALFLGLMRVAEDGGLVRTLARVVSPVLRKLFPEVPANHPAMSAMLMNIICNMLGLGNAATPFGIKAMQELDSLNGEKGTATNAMVLFLAINTSALALLPSGVIGLRAGAGSEDPAGILFTTWVASGTATVVAIVAATLMSRLPAHRRTAPATVQPAGAAVGDAASAAEAAIERLQEERGTLQRLRTPPRAGRWIAAALVAAYLFALGRFLFGPGAAGTIAERLQQVSGQWLMPALVGGIVLYGWVRGVKVYESVVEGAKEGFQIAVRIIPYLVAILVSVGMFRFVGGIDFLSDLLSPATSLIGMPPEAFPMAVMRPLSGSGAFGLLAEMLQTYGPDSRVGYMASTMYGGTETTFYVLAVYFGAVGVQRTRHAMPACLAADAAGMLAAVVVVNLLFG